MDNALDPFWADEEDEYLEFTDELRDELDVEEMLADYLFGALGVGSAPCPSCEDVLPFDGFPVVCELCGLHLQLFLDRSEADRMASLLDESSDGVSAEPTLLKTLGWVLAYTFGSHPRGEVSAGTSPPQLEPRRRSA